MIPDNENIIDVSDEELSQMGWGKYKHILDSF